MPPSMERLAHLNGTSSLFPPTIDSSSCFNTDSGEYFIRDSSWENSRFQPIDNSRGPDKSSILTQGLPSHQFCCQRHSQTSYAPRVWCPTCGRVVYTSGYISHAGLFTEGNTIDSSSSNLNPMVAGQQFPTMHQQTASTVAGVNDTQSNASSLASQSPGLMPILFDSTLHDLSFLPLPPIEHHSPSLKIPQRQYRPIQILNPLETYGHMYIAFTTENCQSGYPVQEALRRNYVGLRNRDDMGMFGENTSSISIRIEWLGYRSWSRQVKVSTWNTNYKPISLAKLATEIAISLERFIQENQTKPIDIAEEQWQVGPVGSSFIHVNRIILVGLERVSKGSWQPIFHLLS